jgi:diguanylate cyclase (GGDEF)-like protein/PAS domain S-box-containing protein
MFLSLDDNNRNSSENELKFRGIVEDQTQLICLLKYDGSILYANPAFAEYYDAPIEELIGLNVFAAIPKEHHFEIHAHFASLVSDNPHLDVVRTDKLSTHKQTTQYWNLYGKFDKNGNLQEVLAVGIPLNEEHILNIAQKYVSRKIEGLYTATRALLTTLNLEGLFNQILDAATNAIPAAHKGTLHLVARDTGELEMRATLGYADNNPRIQKLSTQSSRGYVAQSVRTRQPLLVPKIENGNLPDDIRDEADQMQFPQSAIVAPLILDGEVLGAVSLESIVESAFTQSDLSLLVSFAATVTAAIRNAQLHAEVQKLAITDALTGLYNRRGLFELGEREIERAHRFDRPLTAVMGDIDLFKQVNDNFGHAVGDEILQLVAVALTNSVRKVDIIGRYGGDEFVILLPEIDLEGGKIVAERLRERVKSTALQTPIARVAVSISLGIAGITDEMLDLKSLLERADNALYQAKTGGRDQSVIDKSQED